MTRISNVGTGGSGGSSGHVIESSGTPLPAEPNLNFTGTGVSVADNPGSHSTDVTITAGGGGAIWGGITGTLSNQTDLQNALNGKQNHTTALDNVSGVNTGDQDLSGLVPYTGATGDVNLGTHAIDANALVIPETTTSTAGIIYKGINPFIHDYPGTVSGGNVFVGLSSGNFSLSGIANVGVGGNNFSHTTTGNNNVGVGIDALSANTTGEFNVAIGRAASDRLQDGSQNIAIGYQTSFYNVSGNNNTAVGCTALNTNTASGNVAIGNQAGFYETGSNKLFIDNVSRASEADARVKALIYGVFDALVANQTLAVNGTLTAANLSGTNTGDQTLPIDSTLTVTDNTTNNASTSAHGFAPKAVAPASGLINVVGIGNGETVYSDKALLDSTAPSTQAFGDSASSGSATVAARRDHKHAMMAAPTSVTGNAGTVTNATLTTALTIDTGTVQISGNAANTSHLTLGAGASSVSGSNTGDQTLPTKAANTDINTGTDDTKFATSLAIAGSYLQPVYNSLSRQAIINGNFDVWQRGTTGSVVSQTILRVADRWFDYSDPGGGSLPTLTRSRQALTPGDILNSFYFSRLATNGAGSSLGTASLSVFSNRIENGVRFLAGLNKTITLSFYARTSISGTKRLGFALGQNYGTGGSPTAVETINGGNVTLTSSWQLFTYTFTLNTIVAKTFGTNNDDYIELDFYNMWGTTEQAIVGASSAESFVGSGNIDIAQVQVCAGSVALPFQPKSFSEELLSCKRYYQIYQQPSLRGVCTTSTTVGRIGMVLPIEMRIAPTPVMGALPIFDGTSITTISSISADYSTSKVVEYDVATPVSTLVLGRVAIIYQSGTTSLALSAEF